MPSEFGDRDCWLPCALLSAVPHSASFGLFFVVSRSVGYLGWEWLHWAAEQRAPVAGCRSCACTWGVRDF